MAADSSSSAPATSLDSRIITTTTTTQAQPLDLLSDADIRIADGTMVAMEQAIDRDSALTSHYVDMTVSESYNGPSNHPHAQNNNSSNTQGEDPSSDYIAMDTENQSSNNNNIDNSNKNNNDDVGSVCSTTSSVESQSGLHDPLGFACICFVVLVGDMSRGVMFPSMWPLVEALGGNHVLLGYSVAAFSFGRVLVNPLFGSWSNQYGYRITLVIACSILLLGTLVYAQVQNIGYPPFLIVAQTILGIGSGTLGVTRAYVADITAQRERTAYMGYLTAVQYLGFAVTPAFGALFNTILGDRDYQWTWLRLNMYTAPAYFMTAIVSVVLYVLVTIFPDHRHEVVLVANPKKLSAKRSAMEQVAQTPTWMMGLSTYECCLLGCMMLNVSTKGSLSSFETMGIALAQSHFNLRASQAALMVAACGALGVLALLSMGHLARLWNDLELIGGGMGFMCLGVASLVNLGGDVPHPAWRYALAMLLIYAIGYPIAQTAILGLFSKIVGRRPQGTLLGWFASAGSLARMLFPIVSGYIANYRNVETLFLVLTVVLIASTLFLMVHRHTLQLLSS
jgi:MFS transporter, ceroid-lipofuscinosis neuronal protein 7